MFADAREVVSGCLLPLAAELLNLSRRCHVPFDVNRRFKLSSDYAAIIDRYPGKSLGEIPADDVQRLNEIEAAINRMTPPAEPQDLKRLYDKFGVDDATAWLRFHVRSEYGDDFTKRLSDLHKQFAAVDFKAQKLLNGEDPDDGRGCTGMAYAIQRIEDQYYESVKERFPGLHYEPDPEDLPKDIRQLWDIIDEHGAVSQAMIAKAMDLRKIAALLRQFTQQSPPKPPKVEAQPDGVGEDGALWWKEQKYPLAGDEYTAVAYLWHKRPRTAHMDDLEAAVYGGRSTSPRWLDGLRNRIKEALEGTPFSLSKERGSPFVTLEGPES